MWDSSTILFYLLCINLVTYALYALDKFYSRKNMWRIPEASLIVCVLVGGLPAAWLARHRLRHKLHTRGFVLKFWLAALVSMFALLGFSLNEWLR